MKSVIVLGCTGSIGVSTMEILADFPDDFRIAGLSAHGNRDALLALGERYPRASLALSGRPDLSDPSIGYEGTRGLLDMIRDTDADMVVNGISGAAGLLPSLAALESGKDLALANKETVVTGGDLIFKAAEKAGRKILPVDSEHSALFHLLENRDPRQVAELILTASGGPFLDYEPDRLKSVTREQALNHPNWSMGAKISVDSATLANKGLEVIEAWKLFHLPLDRIKVLIHRQSLAHSLIRTRDNALYAQISSPDMKLPIQNALFYPNQQPVASAYTDLVGASLTFEKPDTTRFPMLDLAYRAARAAGAAPIVYNGSNEVAVAAFLAGRLAFSRIAQVTEEMLGLSWPDPGDDLEGITETDRLVRRRAESWLTNLNGTDVRE